MKPLTYTELRLFRLIWSWLPAAIKRRVMQRILTQFVPSPPILAAMSRPLTNLVSVPKY
ncbi:MAG: hypothetical protein IKP73_12850 [Bacteroidales bacterium]|nr:hypothetical protein [Bacteroidales bacterium]